MKTFFYVLMTVGLTVTSMLTAEAQNIEQSQTGRQYANYQIKAQYEMAFGSTKQMMILKPNTLLLSFFSKNVQFEENDKRVARLAQDLRSEGIKISVSNTNSLHILLSVRHPANKCLEVIPDCKGFPFLKFRTSFQEHFGITPRFSFNGSYSNYQGIWEFNPISISVKDKKSKEGVKTKSSSETQFTLSATSEFNIFPYVSFEIAEENSEPIFLINTFLEGFGKTVVINTRQHTVVCYYYNAEFKNITWQPDFGKQIKNVIKSFEQDLVDLRDPIRQYLTSETIELWGNCK